MPRRPASCNAWATRSGGRQTGSHLILRKGGRTVVVPQHKPLKPGTLRGILEQAAVTLEEFMAEL